MGQSPEANLVAPILLVVNTEAKEVSNRMVSFAMRDLRMDRVRGRWYKRFNSGGVHTPMMRVRVWVRVRDL